MYYLDLSVVTNALDKLINKRASKIDNGIIAFLFLMKNSNHRIEASTRISFDEKRVENDINHIFSFQEPITTEFNPNTFFILSENFEDTMLVLLHNEKIDLLAMAVVCLQTVEFVSEYDGKHLIQEFIRLFNLPESLIITCFNTDYNSLELKYSLSRTSSEQRKRVITNLFPNPENYPTLDLEGKFHKTLGGVFGRGAFTQKMKGTNALKELLFVPNGLLQNGLTYNRSSFKTSLESNSLNVLFFGPSGTGKSTEARRELIEDRGVKSQNIRQITFHPEYTYSDFVGSLKPCTYYKNAMDLSIFDTIDTIEPRYKNKEPIIEFEFQPGPFIASCLDAVNDNDSTPHALIIDEINRGNVPEILGDVFQLLDREENNYSNSNTELLKFISQKSTNKQFEKGLYIPKNLYIYATINPADQNVYPLDTAFKRRWKRRYWDINDSHIYCSNWKINICGKNIDWLNFVKLINRYLTINLSLSEDKQLGQFFIKLSNTPTQKEIEEESLKVISYLWEDIPKSIRNKLFNVDVKTFSHVNKLLLSETNFNSLFIDGFANELVTIFEGTITNNN